MAQIMPSMSDTLLRNGGPYDARVFQGKAEERAKKNPGVPLVRNNNSVAEVMKVATTDITVSMDIEYKRRLPMEGLRFTFTRATAKTLLDGRMDVDLTICNEDVEVVCLARQLVLALGVHRKYGEAKRPESKL
ncbi:hypothetical protein INS49_009057 [Diaporthe citri]|uniref:uncharacterized protein n=1 Tax=Diaporthe citri TaxID=83186 RepID=UPI001C81E0E6|nr:uncharacterized protein INS49_009057 [Diaporthe citri]KAG6363954.1 hypothetical protein INS49_009057 [Diaporthe citri]